MNLFRSFIIATIASPAILSAEPLKPEFHYTIFIAKSAQDLWTALTEKKVVDQYFMVPLHTIELKKGGKISYGADEEVVTGEIKEITPPTKLVHIFKFDGSDSAVTTVTYEIEPFGNAMCSLTISHTGFESEDQSFAHISSGWAVIASSLKSVLETGHNQPWPKPE